MIKRRGGQCEANQIELASTPSWATTKRAGTRSINGRIENQQLLAKEEDRLFQTKPFIWKKLKKLTHGWVDIGTSRPLACLVISSPQGIGAFLSSFPVGKELLDLLRLALRLSSLLFPARWTDTSSSSSS
jgi:hypothetical protein